MHRVLLTLLLAAVWSGLDARPLQTVLNDGTLRVGVALFAPWTVRDAEGELIGFEIDVARQLAADMGVEADFRVYDFDRLMPALEAGEIDLIAAGLSITPERALHVNFSDPYWRGGVTLATSLERTANVERLEDLNDPAYAIAAVEGTVAAEVARRSLPRARLELFRSVEAATQALLDGEVAGYLEDEPVPTFLALEHAGVIDVPLARPLLETRAAFAVAKGDPDFLAFLDAWIVAREADTWLPTTGKYWFESLAWRTRVANE